MPTKIDATRTTIETPRSLHPPRMHLKTSPLTFALWWIILFLLHAVAIAYYVGASILYRAIRYTNVDFQLSIYSIGIAATEYYKVSTIHWIIAALHILNIFGMILGSIQTKRLTFRLTAPKWLSSGCARLGRSITCKVWSSSFTSAVYGRDGLLGVDYIYFDHFLLARELVETTLQLIQVYRMSYLLPRLWLIRSYVGLLILNCWSTPMVHRYYRDRFVERRMMSLFCDAILDMVSSIGVSFAIFTSYLPQYTDPIFGFPFPNWFEDVWFTNMQQEFQIMMVVSWTDLASRLVFAIGLLQALDAMKDILTQESVIGPSVTQVKPVDNDSNSDSTEHQSKPQTMVHLPVDRPPTKTFRLVHYILEKVGPAFFVTLGFAILGVHLVAETLESTTVIPCRLVLHPWLVNKPACSLVEIDCHQLGGISGSQASLEKAWNAYAFSATARILVRHCPQLGMPPTLQQFHHLTTIKMYNCTIASWTETAALSATMHPILRTLIIVRTNFANGELPSGLVTTAFPPSLMNLVTSATNLRTLPVNLHECWPPGMALMLEMSAFEIVPSVLFQMNVGALSFAGSPIAFVPPELFESPLLCCVMLSYTRIEELPRIVPHPSPELYLLYLQGTNISTFWSWMDPFVHYSLWFNKGFFQAQGTPYCAEREAIAAGNQTQFTSDDPNAHDLASVMDVSTPEHLAFAMAAVACEPRYPFYFPLELQDAMSALRAN